MNRLAPPDLAGLAALRPLLGEINDLKRVHRAGRPGSHAGRGFARSWAALVAGDPPARVALLETAAAVAAARLGAIDAVILARAGLTPGEVRGVLGAAVNAAAGHLDPVTLDGIRDAVDELPEYLDRFEGPGTVPVWVGLLADQPRAGATRPGRPRLVLEPAESHAEHCYITAVYGVLIASHFNAGPAVPFLAGLAHHLHNAYLPDSGFAGEELLGHHLAEVMARFVADALVELPEALAAEASEARRVLLHADTLEARAFHAADVLDRVLQMAQYARAAAFELSQALDDLDLVHPGPLQSFQLEVLSGAGLRP